MGLDVSIGILRAMRDKPGQLALFREKFETVNGFLAAAGLPLHEEPVDVPSFQLQLGFASNLTRLQRFAAFVRAGLDPFVADPTEGEARRKEYVTSVKLNMDRKTGVALLKSPVASGPSFDQLVLHSTSEGMYLPVACSEVLLGVRRDTKIASFYGFSERLREELVLLANSLRLPLDTDIEGDPLWKALERSDPNADDWRRFGTESFVCARLLRMANLSLETRSAIVFS